MTLDQVLEALAGLMGEFAEAQEDPGPGEDNFRCVECLGCYGCRFCVSCLRCEECTYCEGCEDCTGCTQCKKSKACTGCTHCEDCRGCSDSHYLTLCIECEECVQCFACVGLTGEEFCVLNERLSRKEFFELAGKLREAMDERMAKGWRPPWIELDRDRERAPVDDAPWAGAPTSEPQRPTAGPSLGRGARPSRPGGGHRPDPGPSPRSGASSPLGAPRRPSRGGDD